jgi:Zn-dependent protease
MPKTTGARGSIRVARIFGIDIRVHWTFLLLVPLMAWGNSDLSQFWDSLLWIAAVFSSVLVHELAHCFVARRRGVVVEDILLIPIGGLSQMQQVPQAPADEAAIAVVGPLTSLALGLIFGAVGALVGARLWPPTLFAGSWFSRLAWLNLMLGAFNLLPALPMDGGRVLRAELARSHDRRSATRIAGGTARVIALAMAVVGVLYDYWLVVIALFVWLGARSEENAAAGTADDARQNESSGRLGS